MNNPPMHDENQMIDDVLRRYFLSVTPNPWPKVPEVFSKHPLVVNQPRRSLKELIQSPRFILMAVLLLLGMALVWGSFSDRPSARHSTPNSIKDTADKGNLGGTPVGPQK